MSVVNKRVAVLTGVTSGLGAHALDQIVAQPGTRAIVGARSAGPKNVEVLPLDLASLDSVRAFAAAVEERLGGAQIDMLVLNAAAQYRSLTHTVDGFEATFAVNHLAHYLLARLLLSRMAAGGRIIFTTSDTHDPAVLPLLLKPIAPRTLDPQQLAHPNKRNSGAYPASKLCNILTVRALAALDDVQARRIEVVAYNPGLTLGTKLGRADTDRHRPANAPNAFVRWLLRLMTWINPIFHAVTAEHAGRALAQLALGTAKPPAGHIYASLIRGEIKFIEPSTLARSDDARDRLWRESAQMVGL